ncbi:MAG: hypothetical protein ACI96W_002674, partial [Paraglaciecola sp.]
MLLFNSAAVPSSGSEYLGDAVAAFHLDSSLPEHRR